MTNRNVKGTRYSPPKNKEGVSKVTDTPFFYFQFLGWVYAQLDCISIWAERQAQYGFCGKLRHGKRQNPVGGV